MGENFEVKSIFTTNNGINILEVDRGEQEYGYLLVRDYGYIKELFPEFDHPNKEGCFVIEENEEGIY